jgi:glutamine cyclotransferase
LVLLTALLASLLGCRSSAAAPIAVPSGDEPALQVRLEVLDEHPHDTEAFTQGLVVSDGRLFESTGLAGRSTVREVDLDSGRVVRSAPLDGGQFGEGLAAVGDELIQLTWQDGVAIVWDRDTLREHRRIPFEGEGWGLCLDEKGRRLVQTDGTDALIFRDPETFVEQGRVTVTLGDRPLEQLNELECSSDGIWANVWKADSIVRIDPASGRVTAIVDASALGPADAEAADVLNGIARQKDGTWLVTGKNWPTIYEVRFVPA